MVYYEFYIWYDDKGNIGRYQATADEQESHQRPLPRWLGKQVKDGNTQHLIAQWYSEDEIVPNIYKEITAEQAIANLENEVWVAYHESGAYYDTSLENYSETFIEEQNRRLLLLTKQGL